MTCCGALHRSPLHAVTCRYIPLLLSARRYMPLHAVTSRCSSALAVTCRYMPLHAAAPLRSQFAPFEDIWDDRLSQASNGRNGT